MYTVKDVKELREKTGAGMMDCKKALEACEGNMDKAVDWLREKGIAKAQKKASRIAAEGLTIGYSKDNEAILFEINCETDFVTSSDKFKNLALEIRDSLIESHANTTEEALEVKMKSGKTLSQLIIDATATIGEKISFRRFSRITKKDDEVFGIYSHMNGSITAVATLKGTNTAVAKDVAMQVAAMNPVAVTREEVPTEMVEHEREVIREQVKNEANGKPENIIEKMVDGKMNKFYKEVVLNEQEFIKESKTSVSKYVKDNGGEILSFTRLAVGEGIEKKQENFAEEVMSQINGAAK